MITKKSINTILINILKKKNSQKKKKIKKKINFVLPNTI